jgi:hypothetical protein
MHGLTARKRASPTWCVVNKRVALRLTAVSGPCADRLLVRTRCLML